MRGRGIQPLRHLGLLLGLLCILAGCGSNGGSSTTGNTASRSRQLALQLQLSSETASTAPPSGYLRLRRGKCSLATPALSTGLRFGCKPRVAISCPPRSSCSTPHNRRRRRWRLRYRTRPRRHSRCWCQPLPARELRRTVGRRAWRVARPMRRCYCPASLRPRARHCRQFAANDL